MTNRAKNHSLGIRMKGDAIHKTQNRRWSSTVSVMDHADWMAGLTGGHGIESFEVVEHHVYDA